MTKTFIKAALAATVATGLFAAPAMAANSDTKPFTATAKIVKPLTLSKVTDLDFGTITMAPALTSSNVVVGRTGGASTSCGANLTCSAPTAASFTVAGVASQGLNVTFTAPAVLTSGTYTVPFSADVPSTLTLDNTGAGAFNIGGSITVANSTADGTYTGNLTVTVTYQ